MNWKRIAVFGLASLAVSLVAPNGARAGGDLVANGGFELASNGTANTIGQVGYNTSLQAWNLTTNPAAVDVVDQNYDSTGVPVNGGTGYVWGPGYSPGPVNNGFTGSPDGGHFLAADADFETASIYQSITGLTIGQKYTLSFDWAGAQATDASGVVTEWWNVNFGSNSSSVDTTHYTNPGKGFSGWSNFSVTFTAADTSDTLTFNPSFTGLNGMPPVLLLDGVTLQSVPEPSSAIMAVAGVGLVAGVSWIRRRNAKRVSA